MPGRYEGGDYDLAGFCVGSAEKSEIIDGSKVAAGDTLIGLPSSGPHSNGYSLIRKIIEVSNADPNFDCNGSPVGELLLEPTRIYVKAILALMAACPIGAIAHITGGGLPENVVRVRPDNLDARIDTSTWVRPPVFNWLQEQGRIEEPELLRTFNCGIGMVLCVGPQVAQQTLDILQQQGETAWQIGTIEANEDSDATAVVIR